MNQIKSYKLPMAIILESTQTLDSQMLKLHLKYYSYNIDAIVFLADSSMNPWFGIRISGLVPPEGLLVGRPG